MLAEPQPCREGWSPAIFCNGGRRGDGKVWGRPVGITVAKDGTLLISEDGDKTIWRVSYGRQNQSGSLPE